MPSCKSSSLNDSQGISTNIPSTPTINTPIPTDVPTATDTPTPTATLTAIPTITSTPGLGSKHVSTIDGMAMVYIPEGEFLMGSNRYGSREGELPHYVYLDAYWIDETEVTNTMFTSFLNAVNFKEKEGRWNKDHWINLEHIEIENIKGEWVPLEGYEDHPVNFVNWYAANSYCIWANRRVPTEAEWEKAARGLEGYSFPWGNEFDCSKGNFADFITYFGNVIYGGPDCDGYRYTSPVGAFETDVSPYGVKDMAGNMSEWVFDWYSDSYYNFSPYENPTGYFSGEEQPWDYKVARGGSYVHSDWTWVRSASRGVGTATSANQGFRCAQDAAIQE